MAPSPPPAPTLSLFVLRGRYDMTQSPHWYSWNSAGLANWDWISPEQGSCIFLYTFHRFCQLMSQGQLVIYNTGFDTSRIPFQTLWSKKGSWRAQIPSCHQMKGSEACDYVYFCSSDKESRSLLTLTHAPAAVSLRGLPSVQAFINHLLCARHYEYNGSGTDLVPVPTGLAAWRERDT